jgi:hypothetical protein
MHAKALRLGKLKHHSGMSFQTEGDGRTRRWKLVVAALLVGSDALLALVMWLLGCYGSVHFVGYEEDGV